ncbi:hypothetical protein LR48_Vigan08g148300 [Vigna angularis]|uniref:Uncharacterized protein n=1 Tax=Phaseolus angularis TaxID=3914 RepID=A0A0L9V6I2_PHAAN|nr:hypothetical protein LR48_Vigan08g148300 [Vigna angularis]
MTGQSSGHHLSRRAASTKARHPWPPQRHASRAPFTQPSTVAVTAVPPPRCEPFLHHHISHLQRDKLKKPDAQGKLEQIRNGTPFFSNNKRQRNSEGAKVQIEEISGHLCNFGNSEKLKDKIQLLN